MDRDSRILAAMQHLNVAMELLRAVYRDEPPINDVVDEEFLDCRLEDIDFGGSTTRLRNAFHNHNLAVDLHKEGNLRCDGKYFKGKVETVRDLINFSEVDMLFSYNIGRLSVNRMKMVLAEHGLKFSKHGQQP